MKTTATLAFSFCLGASLFAGEAQPYRAKNRSQFTADATVHDPFWPIGYVHRERAVAAGEERPEIDLKTASFEVSSISLFGKERLAVINQKVCGVGEFLRIVLKNQKIAVQVVAIDDGSVTLRYQEQQVSIPLRTQNLAKLSSPPPPSSEDAAAAGASSPAPSPALPTLPVLPGK